MSSFQSCEQKAEHDFSPILFVVVQAIPASMVCVTLWVMHTLYMAKSLHFNCRLLLLHSVFGLTVCYVSDIVNGFLIALENQTGQYPLEVHCSWRTFAQRYTMIVYFLMMPALVVERTCATRFHIYYEKKKWMRIFGFMAIFFQHMAAILLMLKRHRFPWTQRCDELLELREGCFIIAGLIALAAVVFEILRRINNDLMTKRSRHNISRNISSRYQLLENERTSRYFRNSCIITIIFLVLIVLGGWRTPCDPYLVLFTPAVDALTLMSMMTTMGCSEYLRKVLGRSLGCAQTGSFSFFFELANRKRYRVRDEAVIPTQAANHFSQLEIQWRRELTVPGHVRRVATQSSRLRGVLSLNSRVSISIHPGFPTVTAHPVSEFNSI